MKMYSYLVEGLPDGQWRWTVFGDDQKAVGGGATNSEHNGGRAFFWNLAIWAWLDRSAAEHASSRASPEALSRSYLSPP
jgi:hypothetical protein